MGVGRGLAILGRSLSSTEPSIHHISPDSASLVLLCYFFQGSHILQRFYTPSVTLGWVQLSILPNYLAFSIMRSLTRALRPAVRRAQGAVAGVSAATPRGYRPQRASAVAPWLAHVHDTAELTLSTNTSVRQRRPPSLNNPSPP